MSDIPLQQAAQNEPCRSCLTALEAAASMARLVVRFERATRHMIPDPLTQEGLNAIAEVTQALATLPDDSLSDYQVIGANESVENAAGGTFTAGESATPLVADPATEDHRWYAVTVGRAPGVYRGAYHLSGNSTGTPGGTVQRFSDMHRALAAYQAAVLAGSVVEVTVATTRRVITPNDPVNIVDH